ncbi:MAG TPA: hypothetical protein ENJ56_05300 [Anaerolineae bacterium]|nr:hypothetical protein [Anaerolineae bacterium]
MTMRKWLRRLFYFLILLVWLIVMLLPVASFTLARRGEFTLGNTRVFLISERDQGGIGLQSTRDVAREAVCTVTSIRYLMWEGEGENSQSCSCQDGVARVPKRNRCVVP